MLTRTGRLAALVTVLSGGMLLTTPKEAQATTFEWHWACLYNPDYCTNPYMQWFCCEFNGTQERSCGCKYGNLADM